MSLALAFRILGEVRRGTPLPEQREHTASARTTEKLVDQQVCLSLTRHDLDLLLHGFCVACALIGALRGSFCVVHVGFEI